MGLCEDNCADVLAEKQAAVEKARKDYEIGSAKRTKELDNFQLILSENLKKLEILDKSLDSVGTVISSKEQEINGIKLDYRKKRLDLVLTTAASFTSIDQSSISINGIFAPLTNHEIAKFIVYTCQLNGEMEIASPDETCIPLRLAGVDVGLLWGNENFDDCSASLVRSDTDEQNMHLAELVHRNAEGEQVWHPKDSSPDTDRKGRRRLEDYPGDDAYDRDVDADPEYSADEEVNGETSTATNDDGPGEQEKALRNFVEQSQFSRSRIQYIKRANALVEKIDEILKIVESTASEAESSEEESEHNDIGFDPIAHRMTRSTLMERQKYIENGFEFAVSASILLKPIAFNENEDVAREELVALAAATLFYADVSAEHVWQILNFVVPEFEISIDDSEHTCASPLAILCPTKTVYRNGMQIPPLSIIEAGEAACEKAVDEANAGICAPIGDEIPASIPNGFFGYYLVSPRGAQDVIEQAMLGFDKLEEGRSLTDEAEDELKRLKQQRDDLQKEAKELDQMIGGRNESRFGPNGELHSFNNACHSVEAGKYEYEICVFGKALQKEKGKGGGTNLGDWTGMDIDHESGQITLKWENGQGCWNGPSRSATVHLRCGAENKVLSAEEPDTCRYVLEMESHIACHERYFEKNFV